MKRKIIEINEELCNGCGACVLKCAKGAIKIVNGKAKLMSDSYCDGMGYCLGRCPTGALKIIEREAQAFEEKKSKPHQCCPGLKMKATTLANWPIQISLVNETAKYFENAEVVIAADCTAFADPTFLSEQKGKVLLIGCPKLDQAELYIEKLARIFKSNSIKSITVVRMSVPCCQGMTVITQRALDLSGKDIPLNEKIISLG